MSVGQAAGTHCVLSESCVGTTTQPGSCGLGMVALWFGSESCREFPPGPDFLTRCRHIRTSQSLGSSSVCPALLVSDSLSRPLDLFWPVTSRSTRLPEFQGQTCWQGSKFSPDGKALIYTDFKGTSAIYQYDVATKRLRQLSYEPRHQALIPQNCLVRLQHLRPSWLVSVLAYL